MIVCSRCKASKEQLPQQPMGGKQGRGHERLLEPDGCVINREGLNKLGQGSDLRLSGLSACECPR